MNWATFVFAVIHPSGISRAPRHAPCRGRHGFRDQEWWRFLTRQWGCPRTDQRCGTGCVRSRVAAVALLLLVVAGQRAQALSSAFTYQGQLRQSGVLVNGNCDSQFALFDAVTGGSQVGSTQTVSPVSVSNGLFTVQLDFGNEAFVDDDRWLEISVRCPTGVGAYITLAPRQQLTGAPYGLNDWHLTGNAGTSAGPNFLGTTDNEALELKVNSTRALRLEPNPTSPNVLGGMGNRTRSGVVGAAIGGGGAVGFFNLVTDDYGTIGGGSNNQAGTDDGVTDTQTYATVCGGANNVASGAAATVAGGNSNTAAGGAATVSGGTENSAVKENDAVAGGTSNIANGGGATVSGGVANVVTGLGGAIGGGSFNQVSGSSATVPGGRQNHAIGEYSFAAGCNAMASTGSFVWGDSNCDLNYVPLANFFLARVSGGAAFHTNPTGAPIAGVTLAAGASAWSSASDRNSKENFEPVDGREVLERVAAMPIRTWNWKSQEPSIRHIGPVAQDFSAAFHVGEDDTHISTVDADGVALAAIQGLYQLLREKDAEISALKASNAAQIRALQRQNDMLEARLTAIEHAIPAAVTATCREVSTTASVRALLP